MHRGSGRAPGLFHHGSPSGQQLQGNNGTAQYSRAGSHIHTGKSLPPLLLTDDTSNIPTILFQKAAATRFAQQKPPKLGKQYESLKRRVGYFEEELCAMKTKLDNMQVDDSHTEKD